jgi:FKBP-type peptidyl-prolyl cis-trans isomerase FklB
MKKTLLILIISLTHSIHSQTVVKKALGDYSILKVYNGIEVLLLQSNEQKIEIKGEKSEKVKIKIENFLSGMKEVINGKEPKINNDQALMIIQNYFAKKQSAMSEEKIDEGRTFLEENGKKEGVTTLESGLQYTVITEGTGPKPKLEDNVTTHYHGTLIDGTVFDSSVDRGEPASFPVGGVIKGWTEALQLMSVGSKWKLFVPYDLAYGERGAGQQIGPYSTLIFEVELLSIN